MNAYEYLLNLVDTLDANLDAGNIKPDKDYHPDCDCISCMAYSELIRLLEEIKTNNPLEFSKVTK